MRFPNPSRIRCIVASFFLLLNEVDALHRPEALVPPAPCAEAQRAEFALAIGAGFTFLHRVLLVMGGAVSYRVAHANGTG